MKKNIIMLVILLITTCPAYSQKQDNGNAPLPRTDRVTEDGIITNPSGPIQDEFGKGNVRSVKYADNGTVELVAGNLNAGITAIDRLDKCYQFFALHKEIFGLIDPRNELVLIGESSSALKFRQFHSGVELDADRIIVYINSDGDISGIHGRFYPEVRSLKTTPDIEKEKALEIAIAEYRKKYNGLEPISQVIDLLFLKDKNSFYLGWRVGLSSWCYCIDATDGKIRCSYLAASY